MDHFNAQMYVHVTHTCMKQNLHLLNNATMQLYADPILHATHRSIHVSHRFEPFVVHTHIHAHTHTDAHKHTPLHTQAQTHVHTHTHNML